MNKEIKKIKLNDLKTIDSYKVQAIIEGKFPTYQDIKDFGRVKNSKDALIHCLNEMFDKDLPRTTRNFDLINKLGEEYKKCDIDSVIEFVPNDAFDMIGQLYYFCITNKNVIGVTDKQFFEIVDHYNAYLFDMGIVYDIEKGINRFYLFNIDAIMAFGKIFDNAKMYVDIIEEHKDFERIVRGLLYTYGIIETDFALEQVNKFLDTKYSKEEFYDKMYCNLALNLLVNPTTYSVNFPATKEYKKHTTEFECLCLNEWNTDGFDMYEFLERRLQLNLNYKSFTKEEIVIRDSYIIKNHEYQLLYDLYGEDRFNKHLLERLVVGHLYYCHLDPFALKHFTYWLENEEEFEEATKLLMNYFNSIPQYAFGGYSPDEMTQILYSPKSKTYSTWKPKK